jgi:hypothetical protein
LTTTILAPVGFWLDAGVQADPASQSGKPIRRTDPATGVEGNSFDGTFGGNLPQPSRKI